MVHHVLNPKLENWSMEWGEAWGLGRAWAEVCGASRGQPHVQSTGLGKPQEATMMILGRAEKFLSCDAGKGVGRERGRESPFASKSNCDFPPFWPFKTCVPNISEQPIWFPLQSRDWRVHNMGRAPDGLLPG